MVKLDKRYNNEDINSYKYVLKNDDDQKVYVYELQEILLDILKDIDVICKKHNIPYILTGGSCLGAVRHEGFIPWDDDADIGMMIDDFKEFEKIIVNELPEKYVVHSFNLNSKYSIGIPSMKIRLKDSWCKELNPLMANKCKDSDGIFIDVFILDYMNINKYAEYPARLLSLLMMSIVVLFENLFINLVFMKKWFYKFSEYYSKRQKRKGSMYIGYNLDWTFGPIKNPTVYTYDSVFPAKYVKFEDTHLPIPNNPDELLSREISPRYKELPSIKDRVPKHIKDIKIKE